LVVDHEANPLLVKVGFHQGPRPKKLRNWVMLLVENKNLDLYISVLVQNMKKLKWHWCDILPCQISTCYIQEHTLPRLRNQL
jgi:hypothetical protein